MKRIIISEVDVSYKEKPSYHPKLSIVIAFLLEGLLQLKWKIFEADRVDKEWKTGRKERGRKTKKREEIGPKSERQL